MRPPTSTHPEDETGLVLFESASPMSLRDSRARVGMEATLWGDPHARDLAVDALREPGRSLVLSVRAALSGLLPDLIVAWILAEAPTLASRTDDLWAVTQEALVNAALHGNLGLPSHLDPAKDLWVDIEARLRTVPYNRRLVVVGLHRRGGHLDLTIQDEGNGFDPKGVALLPPDTLSLSGRGFALMARFSDGVDHEDEGRRLRLRFDCPTVVDAPLGRGELVLIADDDEIVRNVLKGYLAKGGAYRFVEASDGAMALEMVRRLKPDLLVLDMRMPHMDGLEVIEILRADPEYRDLPIMAVTAAQEREERNRILRAGASRIFNKPVDGPLFAELARSMLEHGALLRNLRDYHERTQRELDLAHGVQLSLLPTEDMKAQVAERHGCLIQSHYESCGELGGDYWGLRDLDENRIAVFTVDFSGHGVAPALQTMRLHTFLRDARAPADDPAQVLAELNQFLVEVLSVENFATMFYGVIDFAADTLTYAAAAAPPPLIGVKRTEKVARGNGEGLPLGILEDTDYDMRVMAFPPGSILFLYSDALYETPLRPAGEPWEIEGVERVFSGRLSRLSRRQGLERMVHAFHARAPRNLPDDLTCLWIER
ncbi:MAG: SpoIIE family protein phosphatase [Rhodospirillum sp.]|nr:SpoIIE family protein phosphatase [Rhodospirillum sp.]MCF8491838.1 SpoIIE family protein phosphatase [Rhodospirillum sp.]MCF8502459.1 SpoIIE family protein phosphatase [Rhodospirillum sp.]